VLPAEGKLHFHLNLNPPPASATLTRIIASLSTSPAVADKVSIHHAYAPALEHAGQIRLGDDCAAIPDGTGHLLLAAEGMLPWFVKEDPWFAGYCAVMVNISDVAAMGGRPLAIVNVLWTSGTESSAAIWEGMNAAARAYGVPIVGGHTAASDAGNAYLAAAVLGRAERLISSFDAKPGDDLLMAVDLRGAYRGERPFWNASTGAPAERLQGDLAILPSLAASAACLAGKDISNGGIPGTLAMLLECSGVGAELWLDRLPIPDGVALERWLISFPSFGFLLAVNPSRTAEVIEKFTAREIACAPVGRITASRSLVLTLGDARQLFLQWQEGAEAGWRLHTTSP
jgi:AIR synthase-related protein